MEIPKALADKRDELQSAHCDEWGVESVAHFIDGFDLCWEELAPVVEACRKVHDDEETGHWGPDITMKAVLAEALEKLNGDG